MVCQTCYLAVPGLEAVNAMVADPVRATAYGQAGRQRCIDEFSWARIAER